jgi:esterase/lipase superfamily enzyme
MNKEQHHWYSQRTGREMSVRVYGHYGLPILVFPTSGGDEREYEGQGMIAALGHHIDAGRVKFYSSTP